MEESSQQRRMRKEGFGAMVILMMSAPTILEMGVRRLLVQKEGASVETSIQYGDWRVELNLYI